MKKEHVLKQSSRLFSVEICAPVSGKRIGTGFFVLADGAIATARHVLKDGGMNPADGSSLQGVVGLALHLPRKHEQVQLEVFVPEVNEYGICRPPKRYKAFFRAGVAPPSHDDVALLQLGECLDDGTRLSLTAQEVAIVGQAVGSEGHDFSSYGFRVSGEEKYGLPAVGWILDLGGKPAVAQGAQDEMCEPLITMHSSEIKKGMSGAPVVDDDTNLVVGVVAKEFEPGRESKDRDLCFAVDAAVLHKPPMSVPIHQGPAPLAALTLDELEIRIDDYRASRPGSFLKDAVPPPGEWVERASLSAALDADWADPSVRLVELAGFGGCGKSALAYRWLASLDPAPDGVFWWDWTRNPNIDEFFEAAVRHFTVDKQDQAVALSTFSSPVQRARLLGALLEGRRFLVVLDGLQAVQHQSGDLLGTLKHAALREFLSFFALADTRSMCLLVSRKRAADIARMKTAFRSHDVDRLTPGEGLALLRNYAGSGPDAPPDSVLAEIVDNWQGHALCLTLVGGQLRTRVYAMPHQLLKPPMIGTGAGIGHLLDDYDSVLADYEVAVMGAVSIFRASAPLEAVRQIYPALSKDGWPAAAKLDDIIARLLDRRLLQQAGVDLGEHPLVCEHYRARLQGQRTEDDIGKIHAIAARYYIDRAGAPPALPTLADLGDWISAAYHCCRAGDHEQAFKIYHDKIEQGEELALSWKLNAYATVAAIVEQFFPNGDTNMTPCLPGARERHFLVNRLGVSRMDLGKLNEAASLYERAANIAEQAALRKERLHSLDNLVEVCSYIGALLRGRRNAKEALEVARELDDKSELSDTLAYHGWIAHLMGDTGLAADDFREALALRAQVAPDEAYLTSMYGIWHADHLRQTGQFEQARSVLENVLDYANKEVMQDDISMVHRARGDIASALGENGAAQKEFDEAVRLARNMAETTVLLEALLARGRWAAATGAPDAQADLSEALYYARGGGYQLYEADIRLGLAQLEKNRGDRTRAREHAMTANDLATTTLYHWAKMEAGKLIEALS